MRQADRLVLVAAGAEPAPAGPVAELQKLVSRPDLVIVGSRPPAEALAAWSRYADPWQIVVAESPGVLAALADRLLGRSIGMALAGGGARAFAHIGVLMELEEAGVVVDRIAGCSIGSIVAGLHAIGADGRAMYATAYEEFVRRRPFSDYTVPTASLARGRRTAAGLARALGAETLIEGLPRQFHCVSTDLSTRSRYVHRRGGLAAAVRCSAGLPVLFPPVPEGRRLLVDGGILDNLPVDLLTERDEGPVVAVNIALGSRPVPSRVAQGDAAVRPPRVPALGETLLRTMMIGSGGAVAAARARGAIVITPASMGVGLLEFHQLDPMVAAGRAAARELLEATGTDLYAYLRDRNAAAGGASTRPVASAGRQ